MKSPIGYCKCISVASSENTHSSNFHNIPVGSIVSFKMQFYWTNLKKSFLKMFKCCGFLSSLGWLIWHVLSIFQAHSCVEKAGMISLVKIRELDIDDDFSLRGWTLQKAIDVSTKILLTSTKSRPRFLWCRKHWRQREIGLFGIKISNGSNR